MVRHRDTTAELLLRRAVWVSGMRYRLHRKTLPGKPDLVFVGPRVVVFCDGDFWHGRDWRTRKRRLAVGSNGRYWVAKIESNIARDARVTAALEESGWLVLRFWETDIMRDVNPAVKCIAEALAGRRHP